uniref:Cytochrome P450 n=1 Tax=Angiostrongylus cantonensis TaxID=6313 RepID=A0A0K0CWI5_ANGCA
MLGSNFSSSPKRMDFNGIGTRSLGFGDFPKNTSDYLRTTDLDNEVNEYLMVLFCDGERGDCAGKEYHGMMAYVPKSWCCSDLLGALCRAFLLLKILRLLVFLINVYSTLLCVILYALYELIHKRRYLPPGPTPWLIAGNIPDIVLSSSIDDVFQIWKKRYGSVFTVWIGPIPLVMVSDFMSIKKYFVQNADLFSDRWRNHVTDSLLGGANGVIQVDGPKWREQRRFALHVLRNFGVGRPMMEEKIMDEVHVLFLCFTSFARFFSAS